MITKSPYLKTIGFFLLIAQMLVLGCKKTEVVYQGDLSKYRDRAYQCLQNDDTNHILFNGCIDWHSAVHAHWAVLRYANQVEQSQESDVVINRLKSAALGQERDYMNARPNFEMPYGRAWFLALAIEFENIDSDEIFELMADDMAFSLREYLSERAINPGIREYGNHTWALTQLLRFYRHRGDSDGEQWVSGLVEDNYLDYDPSINPSIELNRSDFFSLWSNWALLLGEYDLETLSDWLDQQSITSEDIRPVNVSNSRRAGGNASRLWGLSWILQVSDEPIYRDAVDDHIASTEQSFEDYEGDYGYGHWVSQFAIYALTQPGMIEPISSN
ncbi:MAG: DUF2891 domain-containing protein [Pseudomonadales bacterium]|nr:DUF2891 domain-containing protein [Pseudomonadales bacterium]